MVRSNEYLYFPLTPSFFICEILILINTITTTMIFKKGIHHVDYDLRFDFLPKPSLRLMAGYIHEGTENPRTIKRCITYVSMYG
jgi:hypothetical protein